MTLPRGIIPAVLVVLAACSGSEPGGDTAASVPDSLRYGGTAVIGFFAEPSSMNSLASADANAEELQSFVLFTPLIRYEADLRPVPHLAEGWDTADAGDGLALTFRLRRDVRWHDGPATTARDVKFTFDRIKAPATGFPKASAFALYDSAAVRDSFTVTFYLQRHPGFLDPWRTVPPMPEHLLGDVPAVELGAHPFGTVSPVGNGPFRFVEHRPGERWVFEANPDFPTALGGRPRLDRLVYRIIEEPTTLMAEFRTGGVDVFRAMPPALAAKAAADPGARVISYPSRSFAFINWNGRRPLFREASVRRAMTLGIDRERIVAAVRQGLGEVATGPVPPFHWGHHEGLEPLPYDPGRAGAILDSAGWRDRDGDGIRERRGEKASFELLTNPNRVREDIMTMVQADLASIGVEVRPRVREAQSLLAAITDPERPFDAFVLGWTADFRLDDRDLFSCARLNGPFAWASYCNPRVDTLLERVARIDDRERARPLWHEYQEIIQRDQPYTFIYYEVRPHGVRRRLRGVKMDIRGPLLSVHDWWIAPADRRSTASP